MAENGPPDPFTDAPSPFDAAVVLGAAVWDSRPSPVFEERLNHAFHLYRQGAVRKLIFTGGRARKKRIAESEAAKAYAIGQGIPARDIYTEDASDTTLRNLVEAKRIIDAQGLGRVLIVSDPLHMRRAMWLAGRLGINATAAPTPTSRYRSWGHKAVFMMREAVFYGTHLFSLRKFS